MQYTRLAEFDDADHPFRQWWNEHGQYMMSGGGRRESIWAARGWVAREQLSEGIEVTDDSMHEIHEVEKGENMAEETQTQEFQNLPLTDAQKVTVTSLQRKLVTVTNQHNDLTQKLRVALTQIAVDNKIDVKNFQLDDDLDIVPIPLAPTAIPGA